MKYQETDIKINIFKINLHKDKSCLSQSFFKNPELLNHALICLGSCNLFVIYLLFLLTWFSCCISFQILFQNIHIGYWYFTAPVILLSKIQFLIVVLLLQVCVQGNKYHRVSRVCKYFSKPFEIARTSFFKTIL